MHRTLWLPILLTSGLLLSPTLVAQKAQKSEQARTTQTSASTLKTMLQKYQGKETSLGKLTEVAGDYFVVERDGVVSMHALAAVHTLRLEKDEETGVMTLEIMLVARD